MIRPEVYAEWATGFGCTIGVAHTFDLTRAPGRPDGETRIQRAILQSIDMGCYRWLQRELLGREWGRKGLPGRYECLIKEWRNAKTKSAKI